MKNWMMKVYVASTASSFFKWSKFGGEGGAFGCWPVVPASLFWSLSGALNRWYRPGGRLYRPLCGSGTTGPTIGRATGRGVQPVLSPAR